MVNLMDVLVERAPVERSVGPVMPGILQHKEDGDLVSAFGSVFSQERHDVGTECGIGRTAS